MPISSAIWRKPGSVAESGLAALGVDQRERLAALGYELLSLRADTPRAASTDTMVVDSQAVGSRPAESPACLVLHVASGAPFSDSHAKLLRALIAAIGLREDEVTSTPIAGVPALAFGVPTSTDAIGMPPPEELRDARAKRALWPVLRRLRRQLLQAEVRSG